VAIRGIPKLDGEVRAISFVLEQREREDHHSLKSVKRLRSSGAR
jgi:vacuolar-type H+-ATPase subunit D/Vma8